TFNNYTISLHDALPIYSSWVIRGASQCPQLNKNLLQIHWYRIKCKFGFPSTYTAHEIRFFIQIGDLQARGIHFCTETVAFKVQADRKSTRLNSSHVKIS